MNIGETKKNGYHHGNLRDELIRLGLEALEKEGAETLSLRALAELAGVSKTAPYRHFKDKEFFLGSLADEGYRLLYETLKACLEKSNNSSPSESTISAMGRAYMDFAVSRPALYRLMNSPLICRMPDELMGWARKSLLLLADTLAKSKATSENLFPAKIGHSSIQTGLPDLNATAAAWAYIHGLVLIRIDGLFPLDLPEPDWNMLAGLVPEFKKVR